MIKKIVIVRIYGYYGGTLVLDVLCKLLRERDIDARVFYTPYTYGYSSHPIKHFIRFWWDWIVITIKSLLPLLIMRTRIRAIDEVLVAYRNRYSDSMTGLKRQILPFFSRKTLVIYPEGMYGNFLKAKNVVRWFLYYNRFPGDNNWYSEDDLFICYRSIFNDWHLNPLGKCVCLYFFDNKKYHQYNYGKRAGNCYIVRKGCKRADLPLVFDGPVIDKLEEEEKVRILNEYEFCYSYDTQTFYCQIAAICGCLPIIVLEPGKSITDYLGEDEMDKCVGIAYGDSPEEIKRAKDTRDQLLESLDYSESNNQNITTFVNYIDERFGGVEFLKK